MKTNTQLTSDPVLPMELWKELKVFYTRADKYCHNLTLLDHMFNELSLVKEQVED